MVQLRQTVCAAGVELENKIVSFSFQIIAHMFLNVEISSL